VVLIATAKRIPSGMASAATRAAIRSRVSRTMNVSSSTARPMAIAASTTALIDAGWRGMFGRNRHSYSCSSPVARSTIGGSGRRESGSRRTGRASSTGPPGPSGSSRSGPQCPTAGLRRSAREDTSPTRAGSRPPAQGVIGAAARACDFGSNGLGKRLDRGDETGARPVQRTRPSGTRSWRRCRNRPSRDQISRSSPRR